MRKYLILLILLLFLPFKVNAVYDVINPDCTNSLKTSLREEGKNVLYRIGRVDGDKGVTFTVYFYNVTNNLIITDKDDKPYNDTKIEGLKAGSKISVNIYSSKNNACEGYKVSTKIINIPYYNPYFESELCTGYENFSLCEEGKNVLVSKEEFENKLLEYKKTLKEEDIEEEIIDDLVEEVHFSLYDFLSEYGIYIIIPIVIIFVIVLIIIIKKKNKERGIL